MTPEIQLEDTHGQIHVFLDTQSDDHIVTLIRDGREVMLPYGEWAWERAVARAQRAVAFL